MKINTRIFGEVDIADEKIVTFPQGIIGFPDLNRFTLIFDEEKGVNAGIRWLQSIDEPNFAMPVMDPLFVKTDYNPQVEDAIFDTIGGIDNDEVLVLVTVTVPKEIKNMTVNLKGPIIINAVTRKAIQVIVDGDENEVKFPVYDILKARKDGE
ncbi:MAG: flagellar assembly protein FliW [Lachnospiraceae bacterium]|jgi:flagellar assembly factor FliW|nr:flagellar assembly protein FliW [Lachnospiraceae bacterium]